jgi:hypothetical protein
MQSLPRGAVLTGLACLAALTNGCGDSRDDRLSDGAAVPDTLTLESSVVVGVVEGDPDYLFGAVYAVAGDSVGRIYVGDRSGPTLRVYDQSGTFITQIARAGEGPGELGGSPTDLLIADDGRLYVRDGRRITIWTLSQTGLVPDSVAETWSTATLGNPANRGRLSRYGRYWYPHSLWLPNEHPRFFYLPFLNGELQGDTLEVPPYPGLTAHRTALLPLGRVDALMLRGLNRVPFSAVPLWDVTPTGTLMSSDGLSSVLLETDVAGDTIRIIPIPEPPVRSIPPQVRADSLQALDERIERVPPGGLERAIGVGPGVVERRLPEIAPPILSLSVGEDGAIWVERWPPADQPTFRHYDVLRESGVSVVVLRAPLTRDPPPWFGKRFVIGVTRDPGTGVERVMRFDLPWN